MLVPRRACEAVLGVRALAAPLRAFVGIELGGAGSPGAAFADGPLLIIAGAIAAALAVRWAVDWARTNSLT